MKGKATKFYIGSVFYQFYGNGARKTSITETIDKYNVRAAGLGIVSKRYLSKAWRHP